MRKKQTKIVVDGNMSAENFFKDLLSCPREWTYETVFSKTKIKFRNVDGLRLYGSIYSWLKQRTQLRRIENEQEEIR